MGFGGAISKIGHQLSQAANNAPKAAAQIGVIGALPVTAAFSSVGAGLTAAAPVLAQGTSILQQNPALAGLLSTATGLPLGGFGATDGGGGGMSLPNGASAAPAGRLPLWVYAVGAVILLVVGVLLLRPKSS